MQAYPRPAAGGLAARPAFTRAPVYLFSVKRFASCCSEYALPRTNCV
jgi:hypothetical protein